MSQVILTFSIIDFIPNDFNFSDFSFIINSESRDFEQEISSALKNKISHKFIIPKKDAKYSIKVIKKNSLIGISEIIIPCYLLQKKEKTYQKICVINTTDSVKRVLFGNTSQENILKIEIKCEFDYKEKNNKLNYSSSTTKKPKMKNLKDMKSTGTFSHNNILENKKNGINNSMNIIKQNSSKKTNNISNISNIKSPKIIKPRIQMFDNVNSDIRPNKKKDIGKISDKKMNQRKKEINDININININKANNIQQNESIIDEELNKEIKENDDEFNNYINDYFKGEHPIEKLDSMNNLEELSEYTKNSILELIEYQTKFYSLYKNNINKQNKLKNLMLQYNEKYLNTKKEINKLDELIDICEIKTDMININKSNKDKKLLIIKENELNNFTDICKDKKLIENAKKEKEDNDKVQLIEKGKNVLIKVLQQCINKYGPVNKIFTLTNSTEPERSNIRKLANKYNLPLTSEIKEEEDELNIPKKEEENDPNINIKQEEEQNDKNISEEKDKEDNLDNNINEIEKEQKEEEPNKNIFEEKITKWEYVSTEKPDSIDKKLELYLKYFYPKRNLPIIIFKKTSMNNYEYGKQKVMIKIEGDTIRVRYLGGYLIIDKFIELNAVNEEKKVKKNSEKNINSNINANNKKKDIKKKKTK